MHITFNSLCEIPHILWSSCLKISAFNSLCEIRAHWQVAPVRPDKLSILFVRFRNIKNLRGECYGYFQFSLRDSFNEPNLYMKSASVPFNSLCEILQRYDEQFSHFWTTFNSLCEILTGGVIILSIFLSIFQFSLWDSLTASYLHPDKLLSILFVRFSFPKWETQVTKYFQFSLWDSLDCS